MFLWKVKCFKLYEFLSNNKQDDKVWNKMPYLIFCWLLHTDKDLIQGKHAQNIHLSKHCYFFKRIFDPQVCLKGAIPWLLISLKWFLDINCLNIRHNSGRSFLGSLGPLNPSASLECQLPTKQACTCQSIECRYKHSQIRFHIS